MKRIKTRKNVKKSHRNKKNKKTRRLTGGGEKEKRERIIKDNFRNMFMNAFKKFIAAIKAGNMERVNEVTEIFNNGFKIMFLLK